MAHTQQMKDLIGDLLDVVNTHYADGMPCNEIISGLAGVIAGSAINDGATRDGVGALFAYFGEQYGTPDKRPAGMVGLGNKEPVRQGDVY